MTMSILDGAESISHQIGEGDIPGPVRAYLAEAFARLTAERDAAVAEFERLRWRQLQIDQNDIDELAEMKAARDAALVERDAADARATDAANERDAALAERAAARRQRDELLNSVDEAHGEVRRLQHTVSRMLNEHTAADARAADTSNERDAALADLARAREALQEAATHFDEIARKALQWAKVFAHNEPAVARWSEIKNHASHRATCARAALGSQS